MAIRVCQLITELRPAGAERCVYELATRLPAHGFEVEVVALRGGVVADALRGAGVPTVTLDLRGKWDIPRMSRLACRLGRGQYDLLHTHLFHADLAGQLARLWAGPSHLVHTVHVAERRRRPMHFAWARLMAGRYDRIICVSRGVRDFHMRRAHLPMHRYMVIPNGIDLDRHVASSQARQRWRQQWGLGEDALACLFVGRLDVQKGVDDLLEAFARAAARDRRLHLMLAGDGPLRELVQRRIAAGDLAGRARLLGFVDDVPGLLSAGDMFLFPSRWEGFGLAAAEAMAAGLPVIGADVVGLNEVVVPGRTGLLCPPGDIESLSGAILRLAGDEQLRHRFGQAGRQHATQHFSIDRYILRHAELYRQVLGR